MEKVLEIEFKSSLTKDEYKNLLKYFDVNDIEIIPQTNFYFEAKKNSLHKRGFSLRVRERLGVYELCVKESKKIGKLEHNHIITKDEFDLLKETGIIPEKHIKRMIKDEVRLATSLTTNRVEFPYKNGILFLDKSMYNGNTDYEIEFEVDKLIFKSDLVELLNFMDIPFRKTVSKTRRAFESINR